MTIDQLLTRLADYQVVLIIYFALVPVLTLVMSFFHSVYGGRRPPWNGIYALLIYLATIPAAILAAATGYLLILEMITVAELRFALAYLPLISFLLTALLVKRAVDYYYLPALLNPLGLLLLLLLSLSSGLYVYNSEILLLFGSPLLTGGLAAILPFLLVRWILSVVFRRKD